MPTFLLVDDSANELLCFLVWPLQRRQWVLICNCLMGALPYSHYVKRSFPVCGVRVLHPAQMTQLDNHHMGRGGGGGAQFVHGRSRMTIDPRTPTMPRRSTSGFCQSGKHCLHQARSAVRCSANRMKGELHPTKNRL